MEKDVPDPPSFALDSMLLQGTRQFDEGQAMGGNDYFAWLKNPERGPHGLLTLFHDLEAKLRRPELR